MTNFEKKKTNTAMISPGQLFVRKSLGMLPDTSIHGLKFLCLKCVN